MKWPEVNLFDLCYPKQWPTISSKQLTSAGYPVYGANGQIGFYHSYNHERPTILITCRGATCGTINISPPQCYVTGNAMSLDNLKRNLIDFRFAYYALRARGLKDVITGAAQPQITRTGLARVTIPLPPLSEQRRIVEILDQADALRKKRAEAGAKAARILPALFYKMFGDPATNPKGWPTDKLGNLFDAVGGGTPSKSIPEYWEGDIPWVSPKDMKFDVIRDTEDHITQDAIRNSATRIINKGAVLVVYRSGILAHSFPVAIAGRNVSINQDLKALTSKSEVRNEYLFGLLSAFPSIGLSCVKKGATVHNIDGSRFLGIEIPKPSKTLQGKFAFHLETLLKHKGMRQAVGQQIEKLFFVLLHRAFTGDLTAKWREAHMKELLQEMEQYAKALGTTNHTKNTKGETP